MLNNYCLDTWLCHKLWDLSSISISNKSSNSWQGKTQEKNEKKENNFFGKIKCFLLVKYMKMEDTSFYLKCTYNFFAPQPTVETWKSIQSKAKNCVKNILYMIFSSISQLKLCNILIHSSQHKNKEMNSFFAKQTFFENSMFSYLFWIANLSGYQTV